MSIDVGIVSVLLKMDAAHLLFIKTKNIKRVEIYCGPGGGLLLQKVCKCSYAPVGAMYTRDNEFEFS